MSTTYHPRGARCEHCNDVVLIVEEQPRWILGLPNRKPPKIRLEHADPGPDGEVFDLVDDGCRRPRVNG